MLELVRFIAGTAALLWGAELLVRGSSRLAIGWGVAPLIVGLTVVAFGTSAPELAVSALAAIESRPGVAVGNIVGSNLCNILLILGLTAVVRPLPVEARLVRWDVPYMILLGGAFWWMAARDGVSTWEGLVLVGALVFYVAQAVLHARRTTTPNKDRAPSGPTWANVLRVVAGLALLVVGSDQLVLAAVHTAAAWGVSELLIGLTIVAVGTSLPEIATSVMAAARGARELAAGNIVGSNIFNMGCVLGLSATLAPGPIVVEPQSLSFDLPWMEVSFLLVLPIMGFRRHVDRWEGLVLMTLYAVYMTAVVLDGMRVLPLAEYRELYTGVGAAIVLPLMVRTAWQRWVSRPS